MSKILRAPDAAPPQVGGLMAQVRCLFPRRVFELLSALSAVPAELPSVVSELASALDGAVA